MANYPKKGPEVDNKNFIRKKEQKMADKDLRPKPSPSLRDMKKKSKIKIKDIEPDFTIKNIGSTEGMRDAAKIEGKPHSSPEGQFESRIRSLPLKVVTFKNGGKVRIAKRGGGRAYGKNS